MGTQRGFTPPAVEPGLPPTNITQIMSARVAGWRAERSTELKPAVRRVTD